MVTCRKCGVSSDYAEGFIKKEGAPGSGMFCPPCWERRQSRGFIIAAVAYFALGGVGLFLHFTEPEDWFGSFLLMLWLFQFFVVATIIPHELGHGLVARLVGWRIFRIVVGVGKTFAKSRLAGFDFDWKPLPLGGITLMAPKSLAWFRTKLFVSVLAGLLVNIGLGAAMFLFYPWQEIGFFDLDYLPAIPKMFLFANALVVVIALWPSTCHYLGSEVASDGQQLLKAFFLKKGLAEEKHAAYFVMESHEALQQNDSRNARLWVDRGLELYPEDFNVLNMAGLTAIEQQEFTRARDTFMRLFGREDLKPIQRYLLANNVAYVDALIGAPELLEEAERLSAEAYRGLPWMPSIIGTRGTVMVERGELSEGIALLERSFKETDDVHGKAENACFLAMAETRRSDLTRARHYLALAQKLNPACCLLPRAQNAVGMSPETRLEQNPAGKF